MRGPDRLPLHSTTQQTRPEARPTNRHHPARYYAHRVQDSLSTRVSKLICAVFLCLLLLIMIITFILWISLRPHRPRVHLRQFSVPGLAQSAAGLESAQISIHVTARNPNTNLGIYYDSVDGMIYYKDQRIGSAQLVGYPFYQEPKNTTNVIGKFGGTTLSVSNSRWREFLADRAKGTVEFRLEILSTVRFKVSSWTFRRHRLHANCVVGVGPDGLILPRYKDQRCPVYFT